MSRSRGPRRLEEFERFSRREHETKAFPLHPLVSSVSSPCNPCPAGRCSTWAEHGEGNPSTRIRISRLFARDVD